MKKKLYIHIGMPKTGSSAIQAFLSLNADFLKRNNFSFPWHPGFGQAYQTSAGNATQLHHWILEGDVDAFKSRLQDIAEGNVILSSEVLFHTCRLEPKKVFDFFSGFDVKIVCYIRKIDDLVESCVNQLVKNHGLIDFSDSHTIVADHDYVTTILNLGKFFNKKNIIVRPYDKKQFKDSDIYTDFLECVGLGFFNKCDVFYPDDNVNPSLNRDAFEFRRILNSFAKINDNDNLKYRLNGILSKYSVESVRNKTRILNENQRRAIEDSFRPRLDELSNVFFQGSNIFENTDDYIKENYGGIRKNEISEILFFVLTEDKEIFNLVLECFIMTRPESVLYYNYFIYALRQDFLCLLQRTRMSSPYELNNDFLSTYIPDILNVEKTVIGANFERNIFSCSEHVASIKRCDQGFMLSSIGQDPYFSIAPIASNRRKIYSVVISINSPKETILQLHYQRCSEPYYGNGKFFNRRIYPGDNEIVFNVFIDDFNGFFRIDPGVTNGDFHFSHITIFSNYCEEMPRNISPFGEFSQVGKLLPEGVETIKKIGHRDYVGGLWEEIGQLQFNFLVAQGLKPEHTLLDIACGSLRGGVHFINYLNPGNYLGLDKEQELINRGIEHELGNAQQAEKQPEFVISDCFEFDHFSKVPDYAIAQSLFTHLVEADIKACLKNLKAFAGDKSLTFFATFFECETPQKGELDTSHSHAKFEYTRAQMEQFGKETGWQVEYIGDWNHPRGQKVARFVNL